mmetsp:Transcript_27976/g.54821  ORF Transcript_27976/g.54821 Transcript_27976/m.54821 type:complete len:159 (-) Transcript_27976:767-1243(-)
MTDAVAKRRTRKYMILSTRRVDRDTETKMYRAIPSSLPPQTHERQETDNYSCLKCPVMKDESLLTLNSNNSKRQKGKPEAKKDKEASQQRDRKDKSKEVKKERQLVEGKKQNWLAEEGKEKPFPSPTNEEKKNSQKRIREIRKKAKTDLKKEENSRSK